MPEVSVIVPARNEEACLADCLRTLVGQAGPSYEIIVVDDDSTDGTRAIAESFPVRVIAADPLPEGWSGKCNAAWSGAQGRERDSGCCSPTPTPSTRQTPLRADCRKRRNLRRGPAFVFAEAGGCTAWPSAR